MQFALRDVRRDGPWARIAVLFAAIVGLFIVTGAFGTSEHLSLPGRSLYWLVVHGAAWTIAIAAFRMVARAGGRLGTHPVARIVLATAVSAVPISAVVYAINRLVFGDVPETPSFLALLAAAAPITAMINLLGVLTQRPEPVSAAAEGAASQAADDGAVREAPTQPGIRFLSRLPERLGRDLRYLAMQDHYVEAVTDLGTTLVLMRLADAVAELDGLPGEQIHRSYWVARHAVTGLERDGDRLFVLLAGGARLPVARSRVAEVRRVFGDLADQRA